MHTLDQILRYLSAGATTTSAPVGTASSCTPSNGNGKGGSAQASIRPFDVATQPPPIRRYRVTTGPVAVPEVLTPWRLPANHCALITDDGRGLAGALANELARAGWGCAIGHLPTRSAPQAQVKVVAIDWTDENRLAQGLAALGRGAGGEPGLRPQRAHRGLPAGRPENVRLTMGSKETVRIANAGGYWGDDPHALRRQLEGPLPLDYLSIDYLAEVTMSILRKQMAKDPSLGYARDFIAQVSPLLDLIVRKGVRLITNAGGVNPRACARALDEAARARGLRLRIALVEGDDLAPRMGELLGRGLAFRHLETGQPLGPAADRLLSANAYFGALPVARALALDPQVVICGRVTDTGITLGPLMHAFGWGPEDWDRLASGIVAGHLLECGAQATGGNFTDWPKVPSFLDMGFPIAECREDGSFTVTKHPGSGGLVTCQTVREQLLYEMGQPRAYLTPDVIADFTTIRLEQEGPDRVRVWGIQGRPPTDQLKVSIALAEGFKAGGALILSGPDARAKAEVFTQVFWERCRRELERAGLPPLDDACTEYVGHDATHRSLTPPGAPSEVLLRLSARARERASLEVFRKLLPSLILSGPPGVAVTGGAPAVSEVVAYWPALMPRDLAQPAVRLWEGGEEREGEEALPWPPAQASGAPLPPPQDPWLGFPEEGPRLRVPLMAIAHARSGDKGDTVNIGLIGRSPQCYAWLRDHLGPEQVRTWFASHCRGRVERHLVPNLWALNFLLEESLGGGGTLSLFVDAQGKTFSQALLRCVVEVPQALLSTVAPAARACPGELQEARP
jgi:hypothetical protein